MNPRLSALIVYVRKGITRSGIGLSLSVRFGALAFWFAVVIVGNAGWVGLDSSLGRRLSQTCERVGRASLQRQHGWLVRQ